MTSLLLLHMSILILAVIVGFISCTVFSVAYLYFLGLRIIRTSFNDKQSAIFAGLIVCSGILAATVSLEAVVLISFAREVSGRLFYAASLIGVVTFALGTSGIAGVPIPIEVALAHRRVTKWGLLIGNSLVLAVNALSFSMLLPTVL
jgi:uncharacterized membrane protein